ncbi:LysM peptidoglycan-binding domain-containing protein [Antarctobacter heliothermus]|uniref:LysM domain-containing protein n=1 Tax=Antarctobacter heliothermus TaxID=74033 RepID=A0A239CU25_9RHOB|nr:LysM peptidoglycan-binding domain-containing protein [Antarctobacter heliothermus]SNS23746.1 LysM domain-containing protein [Antarctobacter heliothermus]
MIRLTLLIVGFAVSTGALLWSVGEPLETERRDQVSRAGPDTFSLQPAMTRPAALPVATPPISPVSGQPVVAALVPVTRSLRPQARPGHLTAGVPTEPPLADDDDVMTILRAMSYGIVEEMKKPAPIAASPVVVSKATPVPAPLIAAAGRSYTVQPGDSLPGVAFRFYGTTVAYLDILKANQGLLNDPSDLRAGMTLRIPDLN